MLASITPFRLGLRAKLSLAIAAGLIAITTSGACLLWQVTSAQIYRELGGYHHDLVRQVAANLDGKFRLARTSLERIALATPPGIADQPDEMQRYIEDKPVILGLVDRIVVLSKRGEIVAHVPRSPSARGHSMADSEYFRHVLRTRKPYVSKPFRGPYANQPVVHMAVPHFSGQGELELVYAGVLYLLNPDRLGHARELKVGKTGYFVIADPDRTIIAHPDATRVLTRPQANADPLLERMLARESGTEELTLAEGTRAYITVTRLAEADWTIAAVLPEAEALAPLNRARAWVAGLTAVALLLCMLFAWLIAGPMTRRLDRLAAQVRVARGDPGARLTAHAGSSDEIAELGTAFNDLLDTAEKREQQNRILALAVDQANEAVLLADTEGRLTRWNRGAEQMFGWTAAEALGRTVRELHAPMISKAELYANQERLRTTPLLRFEARRQHKSGRAIDIVVTSTAVRDETGRILSTLAIYTDITQAKISEQALRESRERFEKLFQASPDAISLVTLDDGRYVEANEGFERLSGYRAADVLGRTSADLGLWADPAQRSLSFQELRAGRAIRDFEARFLRRDGACRDVAINAVGVEIEGVGHALAIIRDITERKKTEVALRASEDKFSKAFHASPDSIALSKLETGEFLEVNEGFERISGYTRNETIGHTAIELGLWMQPDQRAALVARPASGSAVHEVETVLRRKDGGERSILISLEALDLGGEKCILTIGRDVTEAKRAEQTLRESEERFAKAFHASPDSITIARKDDGHIVLVNEGFVRMYGHSPSEAMGKTIPELGIWPEPSDRARMIAQFEAQGRLKDYEAILRTRTGALRDVLLSVEPIRLASSELMLVVTRDVTERKQAETARQRREEGLRKLDRWVRVLIMAAGNQQQFYLDICAGIVDLVGADIGALPLINADGVTFTYQAVAGAKADLIRGQTLPLMGGGLCGWVAQHGKALLAPDLRTDSRVSPELAKLLDVTSGLLVPLANENQVLGGLSAFRKCRPFDELDLELLNLFSQRVAMVMDNMRLLLELEQRVAERTAELQRANRELEGFSYTVSHDLRAPLRAIHSFSQILSDDFATHLPDEARRLLARVRDNALRMSDLINDLLEFSQVSRTKMAYARVATQAVVAEVLAELGETGVRGEAEVELGLLPDVQGDRALVKLVFTNLIGNACKFSRKVVRPMVRVDGEVRDGMVEFRVRDNGAGFDMQHAHKLFGVFQRLHSEAEFEGTGAGLSIVQRIVERHGGRVWAEGEIGMGATFRFSIPVARAERP